MADPFPHGLIVVPLAASQRHTCADFPCCVFEHLRACRHHYPGGTDEGVSLCPSPRRPSPLLWRVGFHNDLSRPARCSLHVTACTVRWPAFHRPFLDVLQFICHLLNRSQCFGLERSRPPGVEPGSRRRLGKAYTTTWWKTRFDRPRLESATGCSLARPKPATAVRSSIQSSKVAAAAASTLTPICATCSLACPLRPTGRSRTSHPRLGPRPNGSRHCNAPRN